MKKALLLAGIAAAMFASCSENAVVDYSKVDLEGTPIEFTLSQSADASVNTTRGAGTVGGLTPETNVFRGERINLLMTTVGESKWGLRTFNTDTIFGFDAYAYPDTDVYQPEGALVPPGYHLDYSTFTNGASKYYPLSGLSDFFAYYVDDAADPTQVDDQTNPDSMYLTVKLNGTQDLMWGRAVNAWHSRIDNNGSPKEPEYGFSARTARINGRVPRIDLKHLLTRLTFTISNDGQPVTIGSDTYNVKLNAIRVKSACQAKMKVAFNDPASKNCVDNTGNENPDTINVLSIDNLLAWTNDVDWFVLNDSDVVTDWYKGYTWKDATPVQNKKMIPLKQTTIANNLTNGDYQHPVYNPQKVGEAMFIQPGQMAYDMDVEFEFPVKTSSAGLSWEKSTAELRIQFKEDQNGTLVPVALEPGYSYNVNIIVHGLRQIMVNVTIADWEDGGSEDFDVETSGRN